MDKNKAIISLLDKNSRLHVSKISEKIKLNKNTVHYNIKKLLDEKRYQHIL
jgi:DNA-binding Lrp family transcriptional regulator